MHLCCAMEICGMSVIHLAVIISAYSNKNWFVIRHGNDFYCCHPPWFYSIYA